MMLYLKAYTAGFVDFLVVYESMLRGIRLANQFPRIFWNAPKTEKHHGRISARPLFECIERRRVRGNIFIERREWKWFFIERRERQSTLLKRRMRNTPRWRWEEMMKQLKSKMLDRWVGGGQKTELKAEIISLILTKELRPHMWMCYLRIQC